MMNHIKPSSSHSYSSSFSILIPCLKDSSNHIINHHNHGHHHHHGPSSSVSSFSSFFPIGRLKPALYFICILVITTSFYCLISFKSDGLHSSIGFINPRPSSILLSSMSLNSKSQILEQVIYDLNRNYYNLVQNNPHQLSLFSSPSSSSSPSSELSNSVPPSLSLLTPEEVSRFIYFMNNFTKNFGEKFDDGDDSLFAEIETNPEKHIELNFDEESGDNSLEHYLQALGFDCKHFWLLYAMSHPADDNSSSSPLSSSSLPNQASLEKSTPSLIYKSSRFHQTTPRTLFNRSTLFSSDFLSSSITFVTALNSDQFQLGIGFIKSFEAFRNASSHTPNKPFSEDIYGPKNFTLIVYNLGLYSSQLAEIESLCNKTLTDDYDDGSSTNPGKWKLCEIRTFQYDLYPSHVSDSKLAAYRSIILQEVLRDLKFSFRYRNYVMRKANSQKSKVTLKTKNFPDVTLFWLDPQYRFSLKNKFQKIQLLLQLRNDTIYQSGLLSWPIEQPTSALTHPRMFEYFHTTNENFYFHRMIRPGHLMISLTNSTWEPFQWGIMLPWVRCALTADCIAPLGSQYRSSCTLDKKPHYRYSGCHHYDMSALNVVLGIAFNYSSFTYSAPLSTKFFVPFNVKNIKDDELDDSSTNSELDYNDFDYRFEEGTKVPGRFDLVPTDDDIPNELRKVQNSNSEYSSLASSSSTSSFSSSSSFSLLSSDSSFIS